MKKISILTATRAEYGLLEPLIKRFQEMNEFDIRVVVTGAHLSPEFGLTYKEIEQNGVEIDRKIEMLLSADTPAAISKSMGLAMVGFADYFAELRPDLLVVLGDRYETLAVAIAAMNQRIPIVHIHGGETTEGAVDEAIRHAITKLSYLHFTATDEYRNRVIQLGEEPARVFNVGSLGVENILVEKLLTKEELMVILKIDPSYKYAVGTFHPVTLDNNTAAFQTRELLTACVAERTINFIFTKANADTDGRIINSVLDEYANKYDNIHVFTSLGKKRYLSALKYADFVIGNSSSGIVEAPSFGIPTINIGDRQRGRIQAANVINCDTNAERIQQAIKQAMSDDFRGLARRAINPYGNGMTSKKIVEVIRDWINGNRVDIKKRFYDA